ELVRGSSTSVPMMAIIFFFLAGCTLGFDSTLLKDADGSALACNQADGEPCTGGRCQKGSCCTGCWDGVRCLDGRSSAACGLEGAECAACRAPTNACEEGHCVSQRAVVSIDGSQNHTCAVDRLGTLSCWGDNSAGELGGAELPNPYAMEHPVGGS